MILCNILGFHLFLILLTGAVAEDYCNIAYNHLLCNYQGVSETCDNNEVSRRSFTEEEKVQILDTLNTHRSRAALGKFENLEKAANMEQMVWNEELEQIAQAHADRCVDNLLNCTMCHKAINFSTAASHLLFRQDISDALNFKDIFLNELFESSEALPSALNKTKWFSYEDLLLWADMSMIGCGLTVSGESPNGWGHFVTCVRGPLERNDMEQVYQFGEPCSECAPKMECSTDYDGLCTIKKSSSEEVMPTSTTDSYTIEVSTPEWATLPTINHNSTTSTRATTTTKESSSTTDSTVTFTDISILENRASPVMLAKCLTILLILLIYLFFN